MNNYQEIITKFENALLNIDKITAEMILSRTELDLSAYEIISKIVVPVLKNIGDSWENGSVALSQIYMSGRICEQLVDKLLPPQFKSKI